MIEKLGDVLERIVVVCLSAGFAALVVTVGLQVLARNVIKIPLIWTLDIAQVLFTWLIFVGAAVAFRRKAHYRIDLVPDGYPRLGKALDIFSDLAAVVIVIVMVRYGLMLTHMRSTGVIGSLGISEAWSYAAMPTGGVLIGIFLAEKLVRDLSAVVRA